MNLSSDVCTYLYELARTNNGKNLRTEFNGAEVLIVQDVEDADYILRKNAQNYRKNMAWLRQTIGSSRFTEDGKAWEIRRDISQTYFNKFDREQAFRSSAKYAKAALSTLVSDSLNSSRIDDAVLREMTASVLVDNFFGFELGQTEIDLQHVTDLMEIGSSYSFIPPGQTRQLYSDRISTLPELRRKVLNSLQYFRRTDHSASPLLRDLMEADRSENGRVVLEQELISFIAAGTEATAASIGWACFLLAKYSAVQDEIRAAALEFWSTDEPSWRVLSKNNLFKQFISETLRLYPTSPIVSRFSIEPDRLGALNIPANQNVIVSFIGVQHNERYLDKPWDLNLTANSATQIDGDKIAFSMGPRICGGKQFAMLEMITILSVFAAYGKFELTSSRHPEFRWKTQLIADGGQPVLVAAL